MGPELLGVPLYLNSPYYRLILHRL